MTDMKSNSPKQFRWALWWGLGITVACLAIIFFDAIFEALSETGNSANSANDEFANPMWDIFYRIVYRFGIWPMVIYIGIIAPIYEELIFRLWGNGKNWTGYTSEVLMALFSMSIAWWMAPIALAMGMAIMIVYRSDRTKRLFSLMLFSSVLFAFSHIGNYDSSSNIPMFLVAMLHKFGMGLLASYLVINHNILWSMGMHILNNSIIALLIAVGFNMVSIETAVIETDTYRITMQPVLTKSQNKSDYICGWIKDSVFYDISSPNFIAEFMSNRDNNDNPLSFRASETYYPKVEMKVEMLGGSTDYNAVVRAMEQNGWITLDTVGDTIHIRNTYNPLQNIFQE